jgi:membrane protease YdiL (CAAX protease family)
MNQNTKGIAAFILITFVMAWVLWEIPLRLGLDILNPIFQYVALPGAFSPAIAAIVVRKWITREGFADAGLKPSLSKSWRYYLVAWLMPLFVSAIVIGLVVALGIGSPDFTLQRAMSVLAPGTEAPVVPSFTWALMPLGLLVAALFSTFLLWGEEFGWRGYLQIRLFAERPLLAAVTTGIIWGIWHYPLNLRGYNFPEHPFLGLLVFPISTVLLSIIFGWLRLRTGSVWAPSLAHAATNSVGGSLTVLLFLGGAGLPVHQLSGTAGLDSSGSCVSLDHTYRPIETCKSVRVPLLAPGPEPTVHWWWWRVSSAPPE